MRNSAESVKLGRKPALTVLFAVVAAVGFAEPQPAVMLPVKTTPQDPILAEAMREVLTSVFTRSDYYYLLERERVEELLEELELQLSDLLGENAIGIGEMLGATILIAPSVSKLAESYVLNLRFVSAKSGVIVLGDSWQTDTAEGLPALSATAFAEIEELLRQAME